MKISIYAGPPIKAVLEAVTDLEGGGEFNRSARINTVADRYMAIVSHQLGKIGLTDDEWCAVMDANNGMQIMTDTIMSPMAVWANIEDSEGLGEKWGIDTSSLVKKLRNSGPTGLIAVLEAIDRFWGRHHSLTTKEALDASLGRKPANPD